MAEKVNFRFWDMPCQQMLLQAPETGPDDDCQYEYGVKEIAFCLISLQLAGKYILSFWKSGVNHAEKSWFFKSVNIFKQQFTIIITQKLSCIWE